MSKPYDSEYLRHLVGWLETALGLQTVCNYLTLTEDDVSAIRNGLKPIESGLVPALEELVSVAAATGQGEPPDFAPPAPAPDEAAGVAGESAGDSEEWATASSRGGAERPSLEGDAGQIPVETELPIQDDVVAAAAGALLPALVRNPVDDGLLRQSLHDDLFCLRQLQQAERLDRWRRWTVGRHALLIEIALLLRFGTLERGDAQPMDAVRRQREVDRRRGRLAHIDRHDRPGILNWIWMKIVFRRRVGIEDILREARERYLPYE